MLNNRKLSTDHEGVSMNKGVVCKHKSLQTSRGGLQADGRSTIRRKSFTDKGVYRRGTGIYREDGAANTPAQVNPTSAN